MRSLVRRIRGLLGLGVFSAATWALVGVGIMLVIGVVDPPSIDPGEGPLMVAYYLGRTGFIAGIAAGVLLAAIGRHKKLLDIPMGAVIALGAVAGATLPWIAFAPRAMLPFFVVLSAGTAASAFALARRGERRALAEDVEREPVHAVS